MADKSLHLLKLFVIFSRNLVLVINSPYIAFRKLSLGKDLGQSGYIFTLSFIYFTFASLLRSGLHSPYLLTLELNRLVFFSALGFLLSVILLFKLGQLFGGIGSIKGVFLCWSYTLIPTMIWFFVTSLVYLLIPPPRTTSFPGKAFSLLFITFSLALLFWKIILYYLTLRFSLKLDLIKILGVSLILVPLFCVYGVFMYKIGIFRIPFI